MEGKITILEALEMSGLGIVLVFAVLAFLALFIWALGKAISAVDGKKKPAAVNAAPTTAPADDRVILEDISDKDAAVIMAITANNLDIPLENLKFISIKPCKDGKDVK